MCWAFLPAVRCNTWPATQAEQVNSFLKCAVTQVRASMHMDSRKAQISAALIQSYSSSGIMLPILILGNIDIKPQSNRTVWWICDQCPDGHLHRWEACVSSRSNGNNCPQCQGRKVCKHNSLATKAASVAAQWDFEANEGAADSVVAQSNQPVVGSVMSAVTSGVQTSMPGSTWEMVARTAPRMQGQKR